MEQKDTQYEKKTFKVTMLEFIEDELTLVSDPLCSRDVVGQYLYKNSRFTKPRWFNINTIKAEESGRLNMNKNSKTTVKCPLCNE